jgi:uncharacterized damage-inducible protein DinB
MDLDTARNAYAHMEWADSVVWDTVLESPSLCEDAYVQATLLHLHLVQRTFLWMWIEAAGGPVQTAELRPDLDPNAMSPTELKRWALSYYPLLRSWLSEAAERLEAAIEFPHTGALEERLGKPPEPVVVGEAMYQVVTHTAHHRGQVLRRIRELGGEPPLIDYVAWVWMGRPPPTW